MLVSSAASPGTVRVSTRTTENSPQPVQWTDYETHSKASLVINFNSTQRDQAEEALRLSESIPTAGAMESQAEYFIDGKLVHHQKFGVTYAIENVVLPKQIKITTTTAPAWLDPGACLLISRYESR